MTMLDEIQAWLASQTKDGALGVDYSLVDRSDGNGPQIASWDAAKLGPQPSATQLASVSAAAQAIATAAVNDALCGKVDAFRDARLAAGFADSTTGKTWQCDPISVSRWDALATKGFIATQAGQGAVMAPMIAADNSITNMAMSDIYSLLSDRVAAWVQETIVYARQMKNDILAGNPPADITQGWP